MLPLTIRRFATNGDAESAALLEGVIYPEEITHCGAGVKWLRHLHAVAWDRDSVTTRFGAAEDAWPSWVREARRCGGGAETWFHDLVRRYFRGVLKGPFNTLAREQAGFDISWYMPMVSVPAGKEGKGGAAVAAAAAEPSANIEIVTGFACGTVDIDPEPGESECDEEAQVEASAAESEAMMGEGREGP